MPHPTKYQMSFSADPIELEGIQAYALDHIAIDTVYYESDFPIISFPMTIAAGAEVDVFNLALYRTDDDDMILAVKERGQWDYFKWRHPSTMSPSQKVQNVVNGLRKFTEGKKYHDSLLSRFGNLRRAKLRRGLEDKVIEAEYITTSNKPTLMFPYTSTRDVVTLDTEALPEAEKRILSLFEPSQGANLPKTSNGSVRDVEDVIYDLMVRAESMDKQWHSIVVIQRYPISGRTRRVRLFKLREELNKLNTRPDNSRQVILYDTWASNNYMLTIQEDMPL